jgi:hypothetical protein
MRVFSGLQCPGRSRFSFFRSCLFRRERFERDFRPATGKSPLPPLIWKSAKPLGRPVHRCWNAPGCTSVPVFFRFGYERVFFVSAPVYVLSEV